MGRSDKWLSGIVLALVIALSGMAWSQEPPAGPPPGEGPEMMGQGGPGMGPGMGPGGPGMGMGMGPRGMREKMDPETHKKLAALRMTSEAHKKLADLYIEQGKSDEAVAQLKKILELANAVTDENAKRKVSDQIGRVYIEIAQIYLKNNKIAEAEAILNEGVEKTKADNPETASRMVLTLGDMFRKAGKTAEAEKAFQRVIELNAAAQTEQKK